MKVLVVGGAGYIGGSVTDILIKRDIPFTVYDNLLYENHYLKPADFVFGDVRDVQKLKKILPKFTHVIWLAAIVGDAACNIKPSLTISVNRDAVEWFSKNFKGRIIFASTCSVYGENFKNLKESAKPNPLSLYAKTKLEAEKFLKTRDAIIFRLGTVFGISDQFSRIRMDLVVNYMTAEALTKGKLLIHGGKQWRPLIHVHNVAEALVNALDKSVKSGIYNLATFNYQIDSLAKEVSKITGCRMEYAEQKLHDKRTYHVNTEKAQKAGLMKFKPALSVAYGVGQISDLISAGKIKYTTADVYYNERHILSLDHEGRLK